MREIVFDTETTGFDPETGDRVVEIGALELVNHLPTGRTFHEYINPERPMPAEAFAVHGLGDDFLRDKPKFAQIAAKWAAFIGADSMLIAHNAQFDLKFMNFELKRAGHPMIAPHRIIDSLALARQKFPGARATLDALCSRFGIDNSSRTLHGALLDSELLAEVYLELIGGRQPDLVLVSNRKDGGGPQADAGPRAPRPRALPTRLTAEEIAAHDDFIAVMGEKAIWRKYVH